MRSVIQGPRRTGKTTRMMSEIRDLIVAGRHGEVLVVFPEIRYADWWLRMWRSLYAAVSPPKYVTISNLIPARGRYLSKVYIEDIDNYDEGIYDPRLEDLVLYSQLGDEEAVFTSSPHEINERSHSRTVSKHEMMLQRLTRLRDEQRRKREDEDRAMLNYMTAYVRFAEATQESPSGT